MGLFFLPKIKGGNQFEKRKTPFVPAAGAYHERRRVFGTGNHSVCRIRANEGMELIFDAKKEFADGEPSCFIHTETQKIKLLRHAEEGYEHAGKLIASITYYGR